MAADQSSDGRSTGISSETPRTTLSDLRYLRVPATAEHLPELRRELAQWAGRTGLDSDAVEALVLAAYEAMANVVEHAYNDPLQGLDLEASYRPEQRRVEVTVTDQGSWSSSSASEPWRGRGLPLIRRLAQETEVTADDGGTTVRMAWSVAE